MNTLGDAAIFASGGTPKRDDPSYWGGEIPWYSASNMTKRFIGDTSVRITDEGLRAGSRIAPAGATLILTRGSGLFNHVPICFAERDVAFNQDVKALIAKDHVDPVFLHYWMESLRPILNRNIGVTGIGAGKFDLSFLSSLPFPHLERAEQERIGKEADAFDRKIALNTAMNETLEATAHALFRDWFVDFGPVRAKMEGRVPYLAPDVWALFPDRLDEEEKPEGWRTQRLSDILELAYGKSLPSPQRRLGQIPVYGSGGIAGWHDKPLISGGTIIVGRKGPVGSIYWEARPCFPIDTVFFVRSEIPASYCLYLLKSLGLEKMNTDAAVPGLNRENAYRLEVAIDANVVQAFSEFTNSLQSRIDANLAENRTLAATRDLLLPRLMSGELRVADAVQIAEAA